VVGALRDGLARMNAECKGSSMRVSRVLLMAEPPSVDGHEITDKGYINQRATLERRKGAGRQALCRRRWCDRHTLRDARGSPGPHRAN